MLHLPDALRALGAYRQFILYKLVSGDVPGKLDKLPIDHRTGAVVTKGGGGAHDRNVWTDATTACEAATRFGAGYGVGFVFTADDPFWFLDIDSCYRDGEWSTLSQEFCAYFAGAAIEISQSGTGLHIIGSGLAPAHTCKNPPLHLEFYTESRFVALTGTGAVGDAGKDCTSLLAPVIAAHFLPDAVDASAVPAEWTDAPAPTWAGDTDDERLIDSALRSRPSMNSVFNGGADFRDLWTCNVAALSQAYPANDNDPGSYDDSSADMALFSHLAYWTGGDCERMLRLAYQSALVRDKWNRDDYIRGSIMRAAISRRVANQWPRYALDAPAVPDVPMTSAAAPCPPPAHPAAAADATRGGYLGVEDQKRLFKGCIYVEDLFGAYLPNEGFLAPNQFKVRFGGRAFVMDASNTRTSRDAWEAFTQSEQIVFPSVHGSCFYPREPSGKVVTIEGRRFVNVWADIHIPAVAGDVSLFLDHLQRIYPNEVDRLILLGYMAAVVQHPGVKFKWCPLLQGVEGNGKTFFSHVLENAIGKTYTHWPKAAEIHSKFNDAMYDKLLICVEDVKITEVQGEMWETLKPMITGERLEIEGKGVKKATKDICFNFIMNCNPQDGLRKTRNDRRIAPLFGAQQTEADLAQCGMTDLYFKRLYDWAKNGGYAPITHYLQHYAIADELNPAVLCLRAPMTTSTETAIQASLGAVEQEIAECIEQRMPGFAGGYVSSTAFDRMLERIGRAKSLTRNKRRDVLHSLGYREHPGLPGGRVAAIIAPDMNRPVLFVRDGHLSLNLRTAVEIQRHYSESQAAAIEGKDAPVLAQVN